MTMVSALKTWLYFSPPNDTMGMDLGTLDILRGRDHGLQKWVCYFRYATGHNITSFDEMRKYMKTECGLKIQKSYK